MRTYNSFVRDFVNLADAMNRTAGYDYASNGGHNGENGAKRVARVPIDVWATEDAFMLEAFLPGVNPEDVEITFEGEELTIRGAYPQPAEETKFVRRELYRGEFERRMSVTVPVDVENIEASFDNGLLTLRVPKAEAVRPKQIKIQAK